MSLADCSYEFESLFSAFAASVRTAVLCDCATCEGSGVPKTKWLASSVTEFEGTAFSFWMPLTVLTNSTWAAFALCSGCTTAWIVSCAWVAWSIEPWNEACAWSAASPVQEAARLFFTFCRVAWTFCSCEAAC